VTKATPPLPAGTLPDEAQRWLRFAAQVGLPGSIKRRIAINDAYRRIEETYPQYLKKEDSNGQS
jgi:hypothetical protein